MDFKNFTIKAQEAVQKATEIAGGNQQQAVETGHLLKEQDLRTSTPQRWRKEQLMASTMLVWPSPLHRAGAASAAAPWRRLSTGR